jgi:hypothetical protein
MRATLVQLPTHFILYSVPKLIGNHLSMVNSINRKWNNSKIMILAGESEISKSIKMNTPSSETVKWWYYLQFEGISLIHTNRQSAEAVGWSVRPINHQIKQQNGKYWNGMNFWFFLFVLWINLYTEANLPQFLVFPLWDTMGLQEIIMNAIFDKHFRCSSTWYRAANNILKFYRWFTAYLLIVGKNCLSIFGD